MTKRHARCAVVRVSAASLRGCLRVADRPTRYEEREVERRELRRVETWLSTERCVHVALALDDGAWPDVWAELRASFEVHLVRLPDLALRRPRDLEAVDSPDAPAAASELVWTVDLFAHALLDEWTVPTALSEGLRELDRGLSLVREEHQRHGSRLEELVKGSTHENATTRALRELHERHLALAERSSSDLRRLAVELVEAARRVSETPRLEPF